MYFCFLHSKKFEMLALRELADEIVDSGEIMPVIEPVRDDRNLEIALDAFVEATMTFCFVVNPPEGPLSAASPQQIKESIFDTSLEDYDNVFPVYYVTRNTSVGDVGAFCAAFSERRVFYFLSEPPAAVVSAIESADPEYVLFLRGSVATATKARFASGISADIMEAFEVANNNASYPDDEFFSEAHIVTPNAEFAHFGDYSITGRELGTGWAPYCVVIHHMYINHAQDDRLFIKHYKSDSNDTQDNPDQKYGEALAKLIADVPSLGHRNHTATVNEYQSDYDNEHYPGLGSLKKRGVSHHVRLLISLA